jgi:hypothetical protein
VRDRGSRITDEMRARIVLLNAEGLSLRKIEDQLEVDGTPLSHMAVRDVVLAHKKALEIAKANPGTGTGKGAGKEPGKVRGRERAKNSAGDSAGNIEGEDEGELPPLPPLPDEADLAAVAHYQVMKETRARMRALPREPKHASMYASLARVARSEAKDFAALLPKPKPDPNKDPHNIMARELIHGHVLSTIVAVETRIGRLR